MYLSKKILFPLVFVPLLAGLTACQSDSGSAGKSSNAMVTYEGFWLAKAYGQGILVEENEAGFIDFSSNYCLLVDVVEATESEIEQAFRLVNGQLEYFADVGTKDFSAPAITFSKTNEIPESCDNGLTSQVGYEDYVKNPLNDLAYFYELFEEYSIHLDFDNVNWPQAYQEALQQIDQTSDDTELLESMYQMIQPLQDLHSSINSPVGYTRAQNKPLHTDIYFQEFKELQEINGELPESMVQTANEYIETQIQTYAGLALNYSDDEGTQVNMAANGQLEWFVNQGIGYLRIGAMTYFADGGNEENLRVLDLALDKIMGDFKGLDGVIVDVRTNPGGQDFLSLAIASRFVSESHHVYSKQAKLGDTRTELKEVHISPRGQNQFTGPVVVLVSASTVSGAEVFSLAMSALDNVVLIGESTQGAFSDALDKTLPNGFEVSLSNEYYLSVDGSWYERQGLPVAFEVELFTKFEREFEIDNGMEAALEWLAHQ